MAHPELDCEMADDPGPFQSLYVVVESEVGKPCGDAIAAPKSGGVVELELVES